MRNRREFKLLCMEQTTETMYMLQMSTNKIVIANRLNQSDITEFGTIEDFKNWSKNKISNNPSFEGSYTANGFRVLNNKIENIH
jgi:hypothetical protein